MMGKKFPGFPRAISTCAHCGKQSYMTRADAKRAAKTISPGEHYSPYQCLDGYWHFGKLSPTIARGYGSRDGSREYPPSATRSVDQFAAQRAVRRRANSRTNNSNNGAGWELPDPAAEWDTDQNSGEIA